MNSFKKYIYIYILFDSRGSYISLARLKTIIQYKQILYDILKFSLLVINMVFSSIN